MYNYLIQASAKYFVSVFISYMKLLPILFQAAAMCDEVWEILPVPAHHLSEAPAIHQPDQSPAGKVKQVPPLYQGSQTVRLLLGEFISIMLELIGFQLL